MSPRAVQSPDKRRPYHVLGSIDEATPDLLRRAKRAAERGSPAQLMRVLDFFLHYDEEIGAALGSVLSSAFSDTIRWVATEDSDEARRQQEVTEAVFDALDFGAMLHELAHCHYSPAKAVMPIWDAFGHDGRSYQAAVTYELLPDEWIYSDTVGGSDIREVYVGRRPLYDYDPGEVVLATARKLPSYQNIDFTRFGKGMAALRFGVYAWFNWADWAGYNEAVGIPTVIGTILEGASPEAKKMLTAAVYGLASDSRAIKGENTDIKYLERGQDGTPLFDTFGDKAGRARSLTIKGESLTEGPRGSTGSFAASRTSEGVLLNVAQGLVNRVLAIVTRRLVNPFLDLNFNRRLVRPVGLVKRAVNLTEETRIDKFLLESGVPLSLSELRERYGRSGPNDDEDTVTGERPFDPFGGV